jgi:hypothetical protein
MKDLRLSDVKVCDSFLTQRAFRAAYCQWLLPINAKNQKEMLAHFANVGVYGPYSGLKVAGIADLSFLADFPNLLYLEVVDQKKVNLAPLQKLENLRGLRIETPGTGLDFSSFPHLEVLLGDWHIDNRNLAACQELRQLRTWGFKPKSTDLAELAGLTRLEWLALTKTSIESLAGIEPLEDLRYLDIAYAPQLESLAALGTGDMQLRELNFSNAKKIDSYEPIAALRWLRRLWLSSCAPCANLKWLQGMQRLDFFSFVETNLEDGDLKPLLDLPSLRYVGTMPKKHYNLHVDKLNEQLGQRTKGPKP